MKLSEELNLYAEQEEDWDDFWTDLLRKWAEEAKELEAKCGIV